MVAQLTQALYGASPDTSALASIRAPVLGLYGGDDARVNATIPRPRPRWSRLGKIYEQEMYDGAGHAFLQRQTEQDGKNRNATEKGWPTAIDFLKQHCLDVGKNEADDIAPHQQTASGIAFASAVALIGACLFVLT